MFNIARLMTLASLAFICTAALAVCQEKPRYTSIWVTDMHCGECAKKIARKLYVVPGVVQVKANVPKNLAFVIHQKNKDPLPKSLWDAVESAGFQVVKIQTPEIVITEKPKAAARR